MKCNNPKCENELESAKDLAGRKFCCRACSNSAIKRLGSKESRDKVSKALKGRQKTIPIEKICEHCFSPFSVGAKKLKRRYCSKKCGMTAGARKSADRKTREGTHSGWHNRRGEPSYPEKYFMSVFENENVEGWTRELKVGRWFIDFAFVDKKIAVEIDGRQHEDEERLQSDSLKDAYLILEGWKIIRIKWKNPISDSNRNFLYPQIKSLLAELSIFSLQSI